jgi:hypothetical protein
MSDNYTTRLILGFDLFQIKIHDLNRDTSKFQTDLC